MNNKPTTRLSLRKTVLSVMLTAPIALLPSSLWALPNIGSSNLTKPDNVIVPNPVGQYQSITAPDKTVLKWVDFGYASATPGVPASLIAAGDVVEFNLPSATSGILNIVTGSGTTTVDGTLKSNGSIFVLNQNGIVIGSGGKIDAANVTLSTAPEPSDLYFVANGTLSYAGTPTKGVTIDKGATIQTLDSKGNVMVASMGANVSGTINAGKLEIVSKGAAAVNLAVGGSLNLGKDGSKTVDGVVTNGIGELIVKTDGGALNLGDGGNGSVNVKGGKATIDTTSATTSGAVTLAGTGTFRVYDTQTLMDLTINAGTGAVTLPKLSSRNILVNAGPTNITVTTSYDDATKAGDLVLKSGSTVAGNLTLKSTNGNLNAAVDVTGAGSLISLDAATKDRTLTYSGAGDLVFSSVTTHADHDKTVSLTSTTGSVTLPSFGTASTGIGQGKNTNANLSVKAATDIKQGAGTTIATRNTVTLQAVAGSITLANAGNRIDKLVLKDAPLGATVVATSNNTALLSLNSGTNVLGAADITANSIRLGAGGGDTVAFGSTLKLTANGLAATDTGITDLTNKASIYGALTMSSTQDIALNGNTDNGLSLESKYGQINVTSANNVTVFESSTLNLGAITNTGDLTAVSTGGDIINTGQLKIAGNANFGAGTELAPGNINVDFTAAAGAGNQIGTGKTYTTATTVGASGSAINYPSTLAGKLTLLGDGTSVAAGTVSTTANADVYTSSANITLGAPIAAADVPAPVVGVKDANLILGGTTTLGAATTFASTLGLNGTLKLGAALTLPAAQVVKGNVVVGGDATVPTVATVGATALTLSKELTVGAGGLTIGAGGLTLVAGSVTVTDSIGTTYAAGATIPAGTVIPSGQKITKANALPTGTAIGYGTTLPAGDAAADQLTLPTGLVLPANSTFAGSTDTTKQTVIGATIALPAGTTIASGTVVKNADIDDLPAGTILGSGTKFPGSIALPTGSVLDAGSNLVAGTVIPAGTTLNNSKIYIMDSVSMLTKANPAETTIRGTLLANNVNIVNETNTAFGTLKNDYGTGIAGNLTVKTLNAGSDVKFMHPVAVAGVLSVTAPNDVLATNRSGNVINEVTLTAGGNVDVQSNVNMLVNANLVQNAAGKTASFNTNQALNIGTYASNYTGLTTFATSSNKKAITDSKDGIQIFGDVTFASNGEVKIDNKGHAFGGVTATTGNDGFNVLVTEAGTLRVVSANAKNGNLTLTSSSGDIVQTGKITVAKNSSGSNTATLNAPAGKVDLSAALNEVDTGVAINLTAMNDSSIVQKGKDLLLGNVTVTNGKFAGTIDSTSSDGFRILQKTGTKLNVYGDVTFTGDNGDIILENAGNRMGGILANAGVGNISIVEDTTLNVKSIITASSASVLGTVKLTSAKGDIVSTVDATILPATNVLSAAGATTLTASGGSVSVTLPGSDFKGDVILVSKGDASIIDTAGNTVLGAGTSVGGGLTVRNTVAAPGAKLYQSGAITVVGNSLFDVGAGEIDLTNSANMLGGIRFIGGNAGVKIAEAGTMNLLGGSLATGPVTLSTGGDFITTGPGGTSITNDLTISATGTIKPGSGSLLVTGTFTVFSNAEKDLTALSKSGNLLGKSPINLGTGSYKEPSL